MAHLVDTECDRYHLVSFVIMYFPTFLNLLMVVGFLFCFFYLRNARILLAVCPFWTVCLSVCLTVWNASPSKLLNGLGWNFAAQGRRSVPDNASRIWVAIAAEIPRAENVVFIRWTIVDSVSPSQPLFRKRFIGELFCDRQTRMDEFWAAFLKKKRYAYGNLPYDVLRGAESVPSGIFCVNVALQLHDQIVVTF